MKTREFRCKLLRVWVDDIIVTNPASVEIRYHDGLELPALSIGLYSDASSASWLHLRESAAGVEFVIAQESTMPAGDAWKEVPADTDAILQVMLDFVAAFEERTQGAGEEG
jgi:hypothetical protein